MLTLNLNEEKFYYSIGEVSKMFDVNSSLIRFWEKEFKQISPKKTDSGKRKFTKKDVEIIHSIYHLVKEKGFTLAGAKEHLKNKNNQISKMNEIELKLEQIKSNLAQLIKK